jgi:hypothetical protein
MLGDFLPYKSTRTRYQRYHCKEQKDSKSEISESRDEAERSIKL